MYISVPVRASPHPRDRAAGVTATERVLVGERVDAFWTLISLQETPPTERHEQLLSCTNFFFGANNSREISYFFVRSDEFSTPSVTMDMHFGTLLDLDRVQNGGKH